MWSIVSSMKLLRKPSKRGEGDGDRKSSKDQSNGGGNAKVERRESARLSCGASKFLRSLRSGGHSIKENRDQVNVIALKEFDSENIDLEVRGQEKNPVLRLPERSQSFQEKRLLVVTSKSTESPTSNGNLKIKHSRAQSFVCNTQAHHNSVISNSNPNANPPPNKLNVNLSDKLTDPNKHYTTIKETKRHAHGIPSHSIPCETIYENLEIVREQKSHHSSNSSNSNTNSNSHSAKTNSQQHTTTARILSLSVNKDSQSSHKKLLDDKRKNNSCRRSETELASKMTIYDKDSDRRSSRNSTKDSGYETNHSDYMNFDLISNGSMESVSPKAHSTTNLKYLQSNSNGNGHGNHHHHHDGTKKERDTQRMLMNPTTNSNSLTYTIHKDKGSPDIRLSISEGRKLRRSISEVPSDRLTVSKLQTKTVDNSRAIYSSITNGLSIWNVDKTSKDYGIYHRGSNKNLPSAVSTLPRRSSDYHAAVKSTPSLKHALEVSLENSASSKDKIYHNVIPISPARSTPNLQNTQKQLMHNLNHEYDTPKSIEEQKSKSCGAYLNHIRQNSCPSERHPGLLRIKNFEQSNENVYETSFSPSEFSHQDHQTNQPTNMSSNVGNNGASWSQNDPLSGSPSSPLSGAPVRDTSSLKQTRYGPGHEKYPSWPIPVSSQAQIDPVGELSNVISNSGSSRSKSWTEQTDYPKEKIPSYARPYMKRMNQAYTQQLKTVMEKCERIPPETFDKSNSQRQHNGFSGIVPPPLGYRDMYNGNSFQRLPKSENESHGIRAENSDKEYNIPSPPERDVSEQGKPFTQEDLELYAKKYEEMMTQYAQSEGYHSYISSECSSYISSGTPFLDQLRRESESNQQFWSGDSCDPNDPLFGVGAMVTSGRESVTTVVTNSSSNSSGTETLKWHGSNSDLSMGSGPGSINPRSWDNQQNIAHSAKVPMPQKLHPESVSSHNGMRYLKNKVDSQNSVAKASSFPDGQTPNLKKFPLSTYTRPNTLPLSADKQFCEPEKRIPTPSSMDSTQTSPIIDTSKPPSVAERILELEQQQQSSSQSPLPKLVSTSSAPSNINDKFGKSSSLSNLRDKAQPQHPNLNANRSPLQVKKDAGDMHSMSSESYQQGFWNTFSDSSTMRQSGESPNSPNNNIPVSYTYLDPDKKHKVNDMTLKAIQKKALLSYYERHTGKSSNFSEANPRNQPPLSKNESQVSTNSLEKDSPFPTNRLTLSLPRDIDRLKDTPLIRQDESFLKKEANRTSDEFSQSSSHSSMTISMASNPYSTSVDPNNAEKNDVDHSCPFRNSTDDIASSESARMAYVSKYLPHLVNREASGTVPNWSGVNMKPSSGGNSTSPSKEPAPVPPERPPKKPHLRGLSQQTSDCGKNMSPPPPLPRAPVRQSTTNSSLETLPPPVPSKPTVSITRCLSPELPPPPPPPVPEEEAEVFNDDPLPPPPTMTEVQNFVGARSRSVSGLSSYLHKDSYLAQRKERTLGYEGRYRRTLSPSGLAPKPPGPAEVPSPQRLVSNSTSTGKLDSTLSPSAWEKYHNIRARSTTVIFTSNEISKSTASSQPIFHRSISWDSNLFNNKTGFSQSSMPPPVAQVAPLPQGASEIIRTNQNQSNGSLESSDFYPGSSNSSDNVGGSVKNCASPNLRESRESERDEMNVKTSGPEMVKSSGGGDLSPRYSPESKLTGSDTPLSISPARSESRPENKENIPICSGGKTKKSEFSLRMNCTSDASSQTYSSSSSCSGREDESEVDVMLPRELNGFVSITSSSGSVEDGDLLMRGVTSPNSVASQSLPSTYTGRQKSNEELECEELSRDLAKQLPQGDKLQYLLVPLPEHKTPADYMEGLFPLKLKIRADNEETNFKNQINLQLIPSPVPEDQDAYKKIEKSRLASPITEMVSRNESEDEAVHKRCNGHAPLPADSAYFTTSESKAKFLTQYVKDMHNESISSTDGQELIKQKEELVSRISRKLEILRTEQLEIREEIQSNEHLGHLVIEKVKQTAKRNEFDKFKLHVEEIEKITSLLLGLSGRLARAENALMALAENSNPPEKKILESKRDKLKEQLDEAKILKENIDRRSAQVSGFLQKYLTVEEYADYHHFVKMKAKLIIDSREIDDKIKLGDEQMLALQDTLSSSS